MTSFNEKISDICEKIRLRMDKVIGNEQGTKESLIKPFFNALGIDTEDPDSWKPEFNADMPNKKNSEKVDYAVFKDQAAILFIEAKPYNTSDKILISKDGQLARYFNASQAVKIAIITNGVVYRFFTDLVRPNVQDADPFFTFDARNPIQTDFEVLEMFSPSKFDLKIVRQWASENRSKIEIQNFLNLILTKPEEESDFIRLILDKTIAGVKTKSVVDAYTPKISVLMREAIDQCIKERLDLAKKTDKQPSVTNLMANDVVTTAEELNTFASIKGILAGTGANASEIVYKDFQNWFNISHKKSSNWFCRLHFRDSSRSMMLKIEYERAVEILGSSENIQQKQSMTLINLDQSLNVYPYAKLFSEAFENFAKAKHQENEVENVELSIVKSAS